MSKEKIINKLSDYLFEEMSNKPIGWESSESLRDLQIVLNIFEYKNKLLIPDEYWNEIYLNVCKKIKDERNRDNTETI